MHVVKLGGEKNMSVVCTWDILEKVKHKWPLRIDGQKEGVWVVGIVRAKMQRRDKHGMFDRDGKKRGELGHTVITEGW